jgi:hypothetical protein
LDEATTCITEQLVDDKLLPEDSIIENSILVRSSKGRNRRCTLSPTSAKRMMLSALDDESKEFSMDVSSCDDKALTDQAGQCGDDLLAVEDVSPPQSPLRGVLHREEIDDAHRVISALDDILNSPRLAVDETEEEKYSLDVEEVDLKTCVKEISPPVFVVDIAVVVQKNIGNLTPTPITSEIETEDVDLMSSAEDIELRARDRYMYRMQQAEWRYVWEIASGEAARSARSKAMSSSSYR